jgi:tetratricopeptide (TPR) repeat protein
MAIKCFTDSKELWINYLKNLNKEKAQLKSEQELFYDLSIASVYESSGKDDLALSTYMKAKAVKLPYNHPDKAFAYCGLGSVLFHMEEPAWALRLYLQARQIREETLGGDTVDTATVYNNLGCCMYMLERNQEAKAYFELANAILECELGPQHERTLTSARNISKANKTVLGIVPEYRPLWTTALPHPAPKSKKKKKKKGKKKK